ncbi:MAG: mercuric ion transporter MerT [Thiobacillus sp.]
METKPAKSGASALMAGGVAAMVAAACCIGPLLLVVLGFGGAWMSNLQILEPYRPMALGIAIVFLALAYRKIWKPTDACEPGTLCAVPQTRLMYKILFRLVALLILASIGFPYIAHYFY